LNSLPLARRPSAAEIRAAYAHGKRRGLKFEAVTFEKTQMAVRL